MSDLVSTIDIRPQKTSSDKRSKIKSELSDTLAKEIELIIKNNPIEEPATTPDIFNGMPSAAKPSTFVQPNETFLKPGQFHMSEKKVYLPDNQHCFLRLIPSTPLTLSTKQALDLSRSGTLVPMSRGGTGGSYGRNKYGGYICHTDIDTISNITQLFKTGELWGIDTFVIDKDRLLEWGKTDFGFFPCIDLEHTFIDTLANYLKFASETLKLPLPLKFIAGATDVEGYRMTAPNGIDCGSVRFGGNVVDEHITYEGLIPDYNKKATEILRPFFNHVCEECGVVRPDIEVLE